MDGTVALVGAVGGAGTTRLSLELAGTLARAERTVLVVDAAYATQGLVTATPGTVDPDVTAAVTRDEPLAAATIDLAVDAPGQVAVAPARAPFERLARAKTSECARRLARRLGEAADRYDRVLVDVPPVAANQSVAAVTAADRVGLVVPDSRRGVDSLGRARDRLHDVDAAVDAVVANRAADDPALSDADVAIPEASETALAAAPTSHATDDRFAAAMARLAEMLAGVSVDVEFEESGLLASYRE